MAKKETQYICEVCGLKYPDIKTAEQCEQKHYKVDEITEVKYEKDDRKNEYPLNINVKLKNGYGKETIITFSRKGDYF